MHELSVAYALLEQVECIAMEHRAQAVTKIVLHIGPLAGVEAGLLRRAWPLAAAGTVAAQAALDIEQSVCDAESAVPPNRLLCASCGDFRTRVVRGDDLLLLRIEFDRPKTGAATPERAAQTPQESAANAPIREPA